MQETRVQSLGQDDPLEKEMATHSSILAWRIPWTEAPDGLQSMVLQRAGHDWATNTQNGKKLEIQFLSCASYISSAQKPHIASSSHTRQCQCKILQSWQKVLLDRIVLKHFPNHPSFSCPRPTLPEQRSYASQSPHWNKGHLSEMQVCLLLSCSNFLDKGSEWTNVFWGLAHKKGEGEGRKWRRRVFPGLDLPAPWS